MSLVLPPVVSVAADQRLLLPPIGQQADGLGFHGEQHRS